MQRKQQLLTYINTLHTQYQHAVEVAPELLDEALLSFASQYKETAMAIELAELLVPVVGGFSAGKSTALNSLMHDELLPVDVTAETAIPAELRYSSDEHIIAVGIDGTEQRHPISALSELSANAAQYEVVRLYLERAVLKQLEPITLVDMPGFDSPLDQHNQ
ncbi:MAG: dynamin family protein [Ferrimonas sp.]